MDDRAFASATELAGEIRDRRIGCGELLDFYLARAERHNPALNAIVVWQIEQARERARAADAALACGERWGPLHGIPMTVKESFNLAGLATTFGNPLWKDNIAGGNAFLIDRLLQSGASHPTGCWWCRKCRCNSARRLACKAHWSCRTRRRRPAAGDRSERRCRRRCCPSTADCRRSSASPRR